MAADAVPPLVALLSSQQPAVQKQAAGTLRTLAAGTQLNNNTVIAAGAVPPLVSLLSSQQPTVQKQAAATLRTLAAGNQWSKDAVIAAGAVQPLVVLLSSQQPAVRKQAVGALRKLADGSRHNRSVVISAAGRHALHIQVSLSLVCTRHQHRSCVGALQHSGLLSKVHYIRPEACCGHQCILTLVLSAPCSFTLHLIIHVCLAGWRQVRSSDEQESGRFGLQHK